MRNMSESELGRKWDRCMADTVVKLGELICLWQALGWSRAARARTGSRRGQAAACCCLDGGAR